MQLRPHGHRVQTGDLLHQQSALQTAVGGLHHAVLTGKILIRRQQRIPELRLPLVLPAGVHAPLCHSAARQRRHSPHALRQHQLPGRDGRPDGERDVQSVAVQLHHAHIQGCLHQTGEIRVHSLHALRHGRQRLHQRHGALCGHGFCRLRCRAGQRHIGVGDGVLVLQRRVKLPDKRFERPAAALGQRHRRIAAGADHVVELPAGEGCQPQTGELLQRCGQSPSHEAVAAAASQMDVRTGVTAPQAGHGDAEALHARRIGQRCGQQAIGAHAACAGHGEHALQLGVQIQQLFALQVRAVQRKGAVHAHLLVHGEHRLDGRMYQCVVRQDRQDHGHGNAVVAAQRRLVRPDPLPVGHQVKSLAGHVLGAVVGLGAHHVDVSLQDDRLGALAAGGRRLPDHHVVARLLPVLQSQFLGKVHAQIADDLRVAAAVGHRAQLFKICEHLFWLQAFQNSHFDTPFPCGRGLRAAHSV